MNLFETVKASVSVPAAAKMYGLQANRHGMVRCPFHDDRHPSMKLNEDYFYCFSCSATGDVIVNKKVPKMSEKIPHLAL